MQRTKIVLSPVERQLVADAGVILTKNAVIGKVCELFGVLSAEYGDLLRQYPSLQADAGSRSPKISKGEQYQGFPWVMLDQPRNFEGENSFAIRSFFWWGHYCSITLHLSGTFHKKYGEPLREKIKNAEGWLIGIGDDAWQHHHGNDNYLPVAQFAGKLMQLPFLKISKQFALEDWDRLDELYISAYHQILEWLS